MVHTGLENDSWLNALLSRQPVTSPQRQLARPTRPRWGVTPLAFQLYPTETFAVANCCLFRVSGRPPKVWLVTNAGDRFAPYLRGASWLLRRIGSGAN